jgi:hypothetical protein
VHSIVGGGEALRLGHFCLQVFLHYEAILLPFYATIYHLNNESTVSLLRRVCDIGCKRTYV